MRRIAPAVAAAVCLLTLAACSGKGADSAGARFQTEPQKKPAKPAASSAPKAGAAGVVLPANLPPASMFVGSASWRTGPSRYCRDESCATLAPAAPSSLQAPAGAPVFFSLSAAPVRAQLDITVPGSDQPTSVGLNPGTAMVWQATLPAGVYPMTLTAAYKETVVSWPFSVRIASKPSK
jgi:hypothetical protein